MASYHRILNIFGRNVSASTVKCDIDLDPWEVTINENRWTNKVRLICYPDVFFLICYTGKQRFENGIIIYKEDTAIRRVLRQVGKLPVESEGQGKQQEEKTVGNQETDPTFVTDEYTGKKDEKSRYLFREEEDSLNYHITGWGHEIGMHTIYDPESVKQYRIIIRKGRNQFLRRRMSSALSRHTLVQLAADAVAMGAVESAHALNNRCREIFVGSAYQTHLSNIFGALNMTADISRDKK